jgi:PAS domain S-box-containing protein
MYGLKIIHEQNELFYIIDAIPLLFTAFMLVTTLYVNNYINILSYKIVNQLNSFNKVSQFAEKIGSGQFDVNYELENENDSFGKSLISMRNNLQESAKQEKERQWIFEGIAEIGNLVRNNDSLYKANIAVLEYIVNRVNACQGRIYIVEGDQKQMRIKANAAFGYGRIKEAGNLAFKFGENLVGECCFEKAFIYRTEIPENYPFILSGLKDEPPFQSIITSPLISNEVIYGVIELVSHEKLSELTLKFINELTGLLGQTIFNLQVNDKTKQLLNEIKNSQNRLQTLLENASELINIYEIDGTIRYVSPSVKNILFYQPDEMIGKKEIQYIDKKGLKEYQDLFDTLIYQPENEVKKTFEYTRKDQEKIWVEAVGKNLIDDPAIQGIIINMRDITMKIRAEQEEKKRGQMQALSENSPDLIMRINMMGDFFYINPSIQKYSNLKPQSFLYQNLYSVDMSKTFVDTLINILNNVFTTGSAEVSEAAYEKEDGSTAYLDVKGIPEFDSNGNIETILYVCHDITEAKNVQKELETKNKKITESINYAWRIQNAIVPDDNIIKKYLPDSFILYKPKDVVSGDFPWFYNKQQFSYIAAVDCTGHGVPGAMMSLIGYFHLNEINGHHECLSTGEILDKLHQNVRKTLRQDAEGAEARDGMDVALCRIDHQNNTLQFSGAHRPLYMVRNGEINEFKGTRKAIGGITIRRDNPFDIHEIKIKKGDSFYFFSDGLPDQLGGEEGLKFSPARIRQLVSENHGKPASEIKNIIHDNFIAFMSNRKQIDDVLMIGINF